MQPLQEHGAAWRVGAEQADGAIAGPLPQREVLVFGSASGGPIFRTAGAPSGVRTGNTIEPEPWVGSPSRRRFHRCNWLSVSLTTRAFS